MKSRKDMGRGRPARAAGLLAALALVGLLLLGGCSTISYHAGQAHGALQQVSDEFCVATFNLQVEASALNDQLYQSYYRGRKDLHPLP